MSDITFEIILDHYRNPRNYGELKDATVKIRDSNPLCGDVVEVYLKINDDGRIEKATFKGHGCAISQASASMLIESIQNKNLDDVVKLSKKDVFDMLGVEVGPARVKCALLSLKALKTAVYSYLGKKMDSQEAEELG